MIGLEPAPAVVMSTVALRVLVGGLYSVTVVVAAATSPSLGVPLALALAGLFAFRRRSPA